MTNAHHDAAVQHLTDHQRFVRLVVQREIKGPLEPPQSPRSPQLLKGLSPSGYMANRPPSSGYKRSSDGSSPIDDISQKYISSTNTSPAPPLSTVPHHHNDISSSSIVNSVIKNSSETAADVSENLPKTNGIQNSNSNAQPVPAPRRLNSISGINGISQNGSSTGNKSEDDEAQVSYKRIVLCVRFVWVGFVLKSIVLYKSFICMLQMEFVLGTTAQCWQL